MIVQDGPSVQAVDPLEVLDEVDERARVTGVEHHHAARVDAASRAQRHRQGTPARLPHRPITLPTADSDGLRYDTDLLGLAAHESAATAPR